MTSLDRMIDPQAPRGGTVDRVLDRLREGIIHRRIAPGQRLVEADLTRELGVSRGPLREAFRRLAAEGLIDIVPHRGAMVRRLSLRETSELFEIRTELEALAARLAARAMQDPEARCRFSTAVRSIWREGPRRPGDYTDENQAFHLAVTEASGNSQLEAVMRHLQLPLILLQVRELDAATLDRSVREHRLIAKAILAADEEAAEREMRGHLCRAATLAAEMHPDAISIDAAAGDGSRATSEAI